MHPVNRTLPALVAVTAAIVLAACGGTTTPKGAVSAAGTDGLAAASMPASTLAFIDANADLSSPAWQTALAQATKFPGFASIEQSLRASLSSDDVDFARDIQPWLGKEIGVGLLSVGIADSGPKPRWVGFVAITDAAKAETALTAEASDLKASGTEYKGFREFLDSSEDEPVHAAIGPDALLIASDSASLHLAIDTHEGAPSLADSPLYAEAMADLPADNLLVGFADGAKVAQLAGVALPFAAAEPVDGPAVPEAQLEQAIRQLEALRAVSFSLGATDGGVRLSSTTLVDEAKAAEFGLPEAGSVTLDDLAPADALAFAGGRVGEQALRAAIAQIENDAEVKEGVAQIESTFGLSLANDVIPLLAGEVGLYVAEGAPVKGGLLLRPRDAAAAAQTLTKVTAAVATTSGGAVTFGPLPDGAEGQLGQIEAFDVSWRRDGDVIAIGVGTAGAAPGGGAGERMLDLRRAAGTPDEMSSLVHLDIPRLVAFAERSGAEIEEDVAANLAPFGGFIAWGSSDGGRSTMNAFLQIR